MVFAHVLGWPEDGLVQLGSVTPNPAIKVIFISESCNVTVIQKVPGPDMIKVASPPFQVNLLGFEGLVEWSEGSGLVAIEVQLPDRLGKDKWLL